MNENETYSIVLGGSIAALAPLRGDIHPAAAASGEVHAP